MIGIVKVGEEKYMGEIKQTDNRGQTVIEIINPEKVDIRPNGVVGREEISIPSGYETKSIRIYDPEYLIEINKKKK